MGKEEFSNSFILVCNFLTSILSSLFGLNNTPFLLNTSEYNLIKILLLSLSEFSSLNNLSDVPLLLPNLRYIFPAPITVLSGVTLAVLLIPSKSPN